MYYGRLKTLTASADLSRYEISVLVQPVLRGWAHGGFLGKNQDTIGRRHPT